MATSTCIKCGNTSFELKENAPQGGTYKYYFIQCRACGGVVGVVEYFNISAMLQTLAKKLGFTLN